MCHNSCWWKWHFVEFTFTKIQIVFGWYLVSEFLLGGFALRASHNYRDTRWLAAPPLLNERWPSIRMLAEPPLRTSNATSQLPSSALEALGRLEADRRARCTVSPNLLVLLPLLPGSVLFGAYWECDHLKFVRPPAWSGGPILCLQTTPQLELRRALLVWLFPCGLSLLLCRARYWFQN